MRKHIAVLALTLASISFSLAQTGWFQRQPPNQTGRLNCVFAIDSIFVIAVGDSSTLIKTTDGGLTWNVQSAVGGTNSDLYAVTFTGSETGYVVGERGTILKSTDGGGVWTRQNSGTIQDLTSVDFLDSLKGWAG